MSKAVLGDPIKDRQFEEDVERMLRWCELDNCRNLTADHCRTMQDVGKRLFSVGTTMREVRRKQSSIGRTLPPHEPEGLDQEIGQTPDTEAKPRESDTRSESQSVDAPLDAERQELQKHGDQSEHDENQ